MYTDIHCEHCGAKCSVVKVERQKTGEVTEPEVVTITLDCPNCGHVVTEMGLTPT